MERIIEDIGSCGSFQVLHVFIIQMARFASVWSVYLMMFGNYDPGWKCLPHGVGQNASSWPNHDTDHNVASVVDPSSFLNFSQPMIPTTVLENPENSSHTYFDDSYRNGSRHDSMNASSCSSLEQCRTIHFNPSSSTLVSEFQLICDRSYIPSIILCIQMIGMLIGSYVSGQIGEWFGRKIALYSSTALCSLSSLLAIFSSSWQVYAGFMFFVGASSSGILVTNGLYMMEFLSPKWRGRITGIPTWNVSLSAFAIAIYLLRDWVYVHIATSCVACFATLGVFVSPESLRWLLIHDKVEKAERVVKRILKINNKKVEVSEVLEKLTVLDRDKTADRKYTYLDLFRTGFIRMVTIKIGTIWVLMTLTYYAMAFSVKSLSGDFYINILIASTSEVPFVLMIAPLSNTIGRRWSTVAFLIVATIGCFVIVITYFTASDSLYPVITTYSAFLAKASLASCLCTVFTHTVELYPTAVRNLGVAFHNMLGKVGAIIAPYLIPTDQRSLIISYIFIGLSSVIIIVLTLSLPETKDNPLQDTISVEAKYEITTKETEDNDA